MTFHPDEARDDKGRWTHLAGLLKETGGFTHSLRTGNEPTSGFAVSIPGHELKIKGHASAAQIAGYSAKHHKALSKPHAHLGGWYNEEDGNTYLDVSHVLTTKDQAEQTARKNKQLAYFDLGTFEEHRMDKETGMSLSIITPTVHGGDFDLSGRDGKLAYWKQILPMKSIWYTAKDGSRQKLDFTKEYLTDLANAQGVDKVGFLLADKDNAHTMDPERWRGEVAQMEVRDDGLYGKIVFPSPEAAKAVLDNPDLGVSARIRPNIQRSDGSTVPAGIIHVLGTLDPQVSGMAPWQATDLSTSQDEVLDLSDEEYEDMATKKTTETTEVKALSDYTEEDIEKMTETELDEFLKAYVPEFGDYTGEQTQEVKDEHEDEPEKVLAGAGADMSKTAGSQDIELANQRADAANARAEEALRRVAEATWERDRDLYLSKGVPPHALDLAMPVLCRADDMVIDLSVSNEADVNVSEVVRGLLDALEGTVDLSSEEGHNGHFKIGDGEDPDAEALAHWPEG